MKAQLKRLLESRFPQVLEAYRAIANRIRFRRRFAPLHRRVRAQLYGSGPIEVITGPFRGLKYYNKVVWGPITPKWLGSYEQELQAIVEEIIAADYRTVIDVGCAEGYYAVGLAHRMPRTQVFAYDTDFISRRQTAALARLNGVEARIHLGQLCTGRDITRHSRLHTVIICDIEGAERSLLDPVACPALLNLDMLVEIHEGNWPQSTLGLLKARFETSHAIAEVTAIDRDVWASLSGSEWSGKIDPALLREALEEHRMPGQKWLWMKAHQSVPPAS